MHSLKYQEQAGFDRHHVPKNKSIVWQVLGVFSTLFYSHVIHIFISSGVDY